MALLRQKGPVTVIPLYVLGAYCAVSYLYVGGVIVNAVRKHPDTASPALLFVPFAPIVMAVWIVGWAREGIR